MKANELKVTDLMVGDLVQIKEKDGKKLVGAFRVVAIGKTYLAGVISCFVNHGTVSISYIEDEKRVYETEICNIEPIPLTPEILEKNDILYEKQSYYYVIEDDKDLECTYYIQQVLQGDWVLGVDIGAYDCSVFARVKYVHQLQHALRLCGINKEIEL